MITRREATRNATFGIATILLVSSLFAQARSVTSPDIDDQLAEYFNVYSTIQTIDDKVSEAERASAGQKPSAVVIKHNWVEKFSDHTFSKQPLIPPILASAVANSDLIVMGTPLTARSLPIKNRTFLFTEYGVRVDRVLFDPSHTVSAGDTIILSREGGSIALEQVTVNAIEPQFDQFSLHQHYFFGLKSIKQTGTYRATALKTFAIKGTLVLSASKLESSAELRRNLPDFTSDVEAAVAQRQLKERTGEK